MKRSRFGVTDLLMLLLMAIWGINMTVIKLALRQVPPAPFNMARLAIASTSLLLLVLLIEKSLRIRLRDLPRLLLLSFMGQTLYQLVFIHGIGLTSASHGSVVLGSSPVLIALITCCLGQERLDKRGWAGIFLAFAGLYTIIVGGERLLFTSRILQGDLMILFATLLWALYSICLRPLLKRYSPLRLTAWSFFFGALFYIPFSLGETLRFPWSLLPPSFWFQLFYSGFIGLSLGYAIWFTSVKRVGNTQTAVYSNLQPLFAIMATHIILGEPIKPRLLLGTASILLGILLTKWGGRGTTPSEGRSADTLPEACSD